MGIYTVAGTRPLPRKRAGFLEEWHHCGTTVAALWHRDGAMVAPEWCQRGVPNDNYDWEFKGWCWKKHHRD